MGAAFFAWFLLKTETAAPFLRRFFTVLGPGLVTGAADGRDGFQT
jgi:hypothetical protein